MLKKPLIRGISVVIVILIAAMESVSYAGTFTAFGSKAFTRGSGKPVTETVNFSIKNPNTSYTLHVNSEYSKVSKVSKVSSATIQLNGTTIFDTSDFNQQVSQLQKQVAVAISNNLSVELRSSPGSGLTVLLEGEDSTPPSVILNSPVNGTYTNTPLATVSGTTLDAISWVNSITVNGIAAQLSGESYTSSTLLTEGPNTITATATDAAGNTGNASASVTLDTIPPKITLDPVPSLTNKPQLKISGRIDDTGPITVLTINGIPATLSSNVFTATMSLTEWNNNIVIAAIDKAGNTSSSSVTVNLDTTAPVIAITLPTAGSIVNTGTITATGTIDDNTATVTVNGVTATILNNTFTASIPLTEGLNTITATAIDPAGNSNTYSITVTRKTGPILTILYPTDRSTFSYPYASVSGIVDDHTAAIYINGVAVCESREVRIKGDSPLTEGPTDCTRKSDEFWGSTILQEGANTITVVATNTNGQTTTASVTVYYQDTEPPYIWIYSPEDGSTITTDKIAVSAYVYEYSGVSKVTINGIEATISSEDRCPTCYTATASIPLVEGANTVTVTATDRAGNTATSTARYTLPDKTAPVISIISPTNGSTVNRYSITVTGTIDDNTATVKIKGVYDTYVATVTNNTFSVSGVDLTNGLNTIAVTATDAFGNSNSSSIIVYLDMTPPTLTTATPWVGETGVSIYSSISLTFSEAIDCSTITADALTLSQNWTTNVSGTATCDGNSLTFTPLSPLSPYAIYGVILNAEIKDLIGNASSYYYGWGFKTDKGPVSINITEPASGATINKTHAVIKGTIQSDSKDIGIRVNGRIAEINGENWTAISPLQVGQNTIEATATDSLGNTDKKSITINTETTEQLVKITTNPSSGIAPFNSTLSIETSISNPITSYKIDFEEDGVTDLETINKDGITHMYDIPGIYYPTVTATDNQGNTYTETTVINVLDKTQMDALLKAKWEGMKGALGSTDTTKALSYFDESVKQKFNRVFSDLGSDLPAIAASFEDITLISFTGKIAEYAIGRNQDGQRYIYFIYFMKDKDGIWKIKGM